MYQELFKNAYSTEMATERIPAGMNAANLSKTISN